MNLTRRDFIALGLASYFGIHAKSASGMLANGPVHPDPRPGITGAKVLTADKLKATPDLIPVFDGIRTYPQLADGIRCSCGCATLPDHRSLLSCYEDPGMAMMCEICQAQGELLVKRAKEGQTLAQIRAAIDARFNAGH